ncbi:MAG: hypothetical protein AB7N80_01240 [Bdellovibrionales bacterium]
MGFVSGKNTLLKRKRNKLERREADRKERAEIISKSGPVKYLKTDSTLQCPECNGPMKLKKPKAGQKWKPFWGCINFQITGCKGSRKV